MALLISVPSGALAARRQRRAGSGLHCGSWPAQPVCRGAALVVAVFATVTNRGLDAWFSERTRNIVNRAESVPRPYRRAGRCAGRHRLHCPGPVNSDLFDNDRQTFIRRLATRTAFRTLSGAFVTMS
jgi:two-component system nitrogen regulation sensor histidine kinase NtrY